jgi:hypothetical protein
MNYEQYLHKSMVDLKAKTRGNTPANIYPWNRIRPPGLLARASIPVCVAWRVALNILALLERSNQKDQFAMCWPGAVAPFANPERCKDHYLVNQPLNYGKMIT